MIRSIANELADLIEKKNLQFEEWKKKGDIVKWR